MRKWVMLLALIVLGTAYHILIGAWRLMPITDSVLPRTSGDFIGMAAFLVAVAIGYLLNSTPPQQPEGD